MRFSRLFLVFCLLVCGGGAALAVDAPAPAPPILPQQFGGWQMQGAAQTSPDAGAADPTNAAVLREYGFADFASSTYTRDDGRTLKIRAARFADASGAFGAYTFYLQPDMRREQIGDQGASLGQRVLFYRGHIVIDALFSEESPMSGAELRELAGVLPRPGGNAGNLPPILGFMPPRSYVTNTEKYAMGPLALSALAPPVSADLVDFGVRAEVTLGRYSMPSGEATLMLIYYPTPQLAAEHLRRIDASHQRKPGESSIENAGEFYDKRTGPILAIAAGPLSESDAKTLLGRVNYEANVTWNENTSFDPNKDLGTLLVNIVLLCFILGAMAIVAGVAFGGFRILMKRLFPDKVFDRPEQMEFISLHLTETIVQSRPGSGSGAVVQTAQTPPGAR
ncbi:MAG: hypothetical protein LAO24_20170 [Acidobacteriia bacterium]|nr:hypothetical protein [Terriglobia bacterium]